MHVVIDHSYVNMQALKAHAPCAFVLPVVGVLRAQCAFQAAAARDQAALLAQMLVRALPACVLHLARSK